MNTAEELAEDIREWRLARCLTQQEVARGSGVNQGYLSRVERGEVIPGSLVTAKLASFVENTSDALPVSENGHREDLNDPEVLRKRYVHSTESSRTRRKHTRAILTALPKFDNDDLRLVAGVVTRIAEKNREI